MPREPSELTPYLLRDSSSGPGELPRLVANAKAAGPTLPPTLVATLDNLRAKDDRTMGFISRPLAYSSQMPRNSKREHANLIRLIKGGHVRVREHVGKPPGGTIAARESPYGDRYYELEIGPW